MSNVQPFTFNRSRGIVWVCDLVNSSGYLNDNNSVDDIESFIPRLYYVSKLMVESYGGIFVKWTGDGFLAFFECKLDRKKQELAKSVFEAAGRLTYLANETQLGLTPKDKFEIRHGITYEKDALFMDLKIDDQLFSTDVIGRDVVLAFRISSIKASYPGIVTVEELIERDDQNFVRWRPNTTDVVRIFKGEQYGTDMIMTLKDDKTSPKEKAFQDYLEHMDLQTNNPRNVFAKKMNAGPSWCKKVMTQEGKIFGEVFVEIVKNIFDQFAKNINPK
jgi:hypothetical protein